MKQRIITATTRRNLTHWHTDEGTYFVTFRLFDSLPRHLLRTSKRKEVEEQLDRGHGAAFLLDPRIATLTLDALKYFHGQRYLLHTACVMPTHVHAVLRTAPGIRLGDVVRSWKWFTANQANRILDRDGHFWTREWYDTLIRDERGLERANAYVMANPEKARLMNWRWVERFDTEFFVRYEED